MFKSQKFIDSRTGEIVTQVPLSQIQHFDEYNGPKECGQFDTRIAGRQQAAEIMQAAELRL